ncbi:MAG: tellurite resistance TerB family protein [Desulforhopalus sp.]|nr:tellurite resistance TerB family protein [Desulforhopalus sp.]
MSFGNIVGQLLQQGMAGQSRSKLERAVGPQGLGGVGGIEQILKGVLGGQGGGTSNGSGGNVVSGLLGAAQSFLGNKQVGNLSGGQLGGLGALAGALLGGGGKSVKGAGGGSAMAILGALAINALQGRAVSAGGSSTAVAEYSAVTDPGTKKLLVRAMIAAAKADGRVDNQELERIVGKIGTDGVSDEERQFVSEELRAPVDIAGLAAAVTSPVVAAEVYAASLLAIEADTPEEIGYLRDLAAALGLDAATVARLHEMTGTPG